MENLELKNYIRDCVYMEITKPSFYKLKQQTIDDLILSLQEKFNTDPNEAGYRYGLIYLGKEKYFDIGNGIINELTNFILKDSDGNKFVNKFIVYLYNEIKNCERDNFTYGLMYALEVAHLYLTLFDLGIISRYIC